VVENIVIESDNLMPNVIEFGSDNYFRWGRKKITNKRDNKVSSSWTFAGHPTNQYLAYRS
jgi:hypothetical protein